MKYTITVFGLGFVGLTTAIGFSEKGHKVYGIEPNIERADNIKNGVLPFAEPFLDEALQRHIGVDFTIEDNVTKSVIDSDFIFICVGTPAGKHGEADLTYIYKVLDDISPILEVGKYRIVIIKSTIPPSTTSKRIIPYLEEKGLTIGNGFSIANNPEFLREGKCWEDFMSPDRIVCGVCDKNAEDMLKKLYSSFDAPFCSVTLNTGEFIKYLSNTLLATMISYSNEMAIIADKIGDISVKGAFEILHMDKRWGGCNMASYVYPGCGYGGYCLPKDTIAMTEMARSYNYKSKILEKVIGVNNSVMQFMASKVEEVAVNKETKIGILGLSFKPNSDDVRYSQAAKLISILSSDGYKNIVAHDPIATASFKAMYPLSNIQYHESIDTLFKESDVIVLVTAWPEYKGLDKKYPNKRIIDCRYYL